MRKSIYRYFIKQFRWKTGIAFLFIVTLFTFYFAQVARADGLSDLKKQLKTMQGQIQEIQKKIEKLEIEKKAKVETSKEKFVKEDKDFRVYWKDGVHFTTEDKKFDMKIGGRLHVDAGWFKEDSEVKDKVGKPKDGGEVRRARFYIKGAIYENFLYCLEYDWATGDAALKNAFIGLKNIPYLGTVKAGHFFEPFGLENMTSSNYLTFIGYGLPEAFNPLRNVGIRANSTAFNERMTWSTGIFRDADNQGNLTSNEYSWTTRLTFLPWYEDEGKKLFHLGVCHSLRHPEETLSYSSTPEAHLAPSFVDTGSFAAKRANLVSGEAAIVYGPFSLQAEYVGSIVEQTEDEDVYFQGCYGYISYFLTGEHRPYSKSGGVFSRVRPHNNFSIKNRTFGAWEIATRYSYLDLKDDDISGGIMSDVTVGLNWYLTPNMKIMGNYIHSHLNGVGDADIVETRFQVDF